MTRMRLRKQAFTQDSKKQLGKVVGKVFKGIKKVVSWPGKQIEKEFRMQDEADEKNKEKAKALNEWYR